MAKQGDLKEAGTPMHCGCIGEGYCHHAHDACCGTEPAKTEHYFDGDDGDCAFCGDRESDFDEDQPDEGCLPIERQREKVVAMAKLCGLTTIGPLARTLLFTFGSSKGGPTGKEGWHSVGVNAPDVLREPITTAREQGASAQDKLRAVGYMSAWDDCPAHVAMAVVQKRADVRFTKTDVVVEATDG